ncbi:MAG TPA: inorganic phosphate transporter [Bacteroidia bacterium]|jgi:PiT family inorganic phosphate transporter|nr:inorganic phosphate transporter [Bacteroidia bacterium]
MLSIVFLTILAALIFDFVNGMNDAANSIATIVSTRILSPRVAVIWAAFFNFLALFIFDGSKVAGTVGKGFVASQFVDVYLVLAALLGAIIWAYFFCARLGIPVSSSHSLTGGLLGAAVAKAGFGALVLHTSTGGFFTTKLFITLLFIFLAPMIGLALGYLIMVITMWIARKFNPSRIDKFFRVGQLLSSAAFSIGHGGNDAQKTMGIITVLLFTSRNIPFVKQYLYPYDDFHVPMWVSVTSLSIISLGTLSGGMRIVKTMGMKLTHLKPIGGFSAETAGAITLYGATSMGIPVSTTQTIAGAIMGVGTTRRFSAVRWGVAGNIIATWIFTIPLSAIIAGIIYLLIDLFLVH